MIYLMYTICTSLKYFSVLRQRHICIKFHILLDVRTCIINVFIQKGNYVVILMYLVLSLTHVLDILDKSSMGVTNTIL
jgi:hypothetical protein